MCKHAPRVLLVVDGALDWYYVIYGVNGGPGAGHGGGARRLHRHMDLMTEFMSQKRV